MNQEQCTWEAMSEEQAQKNSVVVSFDERGLDAADRPVIDAVLRDWVRQIKGGQMLTLSTLDASVDAARMDLQQEALAHKSPCMAVPLFAHRWLILAHTQVLREMGRQEVVRSAHENAILCAYREGRPYNADALRSYESMRAQEAA